MNSKSLLTYPYIVPLPSSSDSAKPGPIYLDYQATTPIDPAVLAEMMNALTMNFGNASSKTHIFGWEARDAVEVARSRVAALINANKEEIIFTSGATESNYSAILGVSRFSPMSANRKHVITSKLEHSSLRSCCQLLESQGFEVTYLSPDKDGLIRVEDVLAAIRPDTFLISLMLVNNEIGVINPIAEIGKILKERYPNITFHTDGTQGLGKITVDVNAMNVDLMSMSAHKIYGPKGVGGLYIRRDLQRQIMPVIRGGGQESGIRGGTLNVPGIVGFGKACDRSLELLPNESRRLKDLSQKFYDILKTGFPNLRLNGSATQRVGGNLNLTFPGVDGEALMAALSREVAVSSGAACQGGSANISHVLSSLGLDEALGRATIRFGFGRFTSDEEVTLAAGIILKTIAEILGQTRVFDKTGIVCEIPLSPPATPAVAKDPAPVATTSAPIAIAPAPTPVAVAPAPASITMTYTPAPTPMPFAPIPVATAPTPAPEAKIVPPPPPVAADSKSKDTLPALGLTVRQIGTVENDIQSLEYIAWGQVKSKIVIRPELLPGIEGLEVYSHLIVLFWLDKTDFYKLKHVPQDNYREFAPLGIFLTRCPNRPNPIAMTLVKILSIKGNEIEVLGLDTCNGTPIIDIKPYTPLIDQPKEEVRYPAWVHKLQY